MEDIRAKISQDIMRSFRKNLGQEVIFMCFYMEKTGAGLVTNERPFTGQEMIELFSSVFSASEETILPAVIYSLFNLYGPIRVFDVIKAYAKAFDIKGPYTADRDLADSGSTPPSAPDN
ncbi:MAG: hypothetical protein LJE89_06725 [Deltaproteobacteria bacterium]|nr:hypothetical protein [Deltaproteobacteria bacterium]